VFCSHCSSTSDIGLPGLAIFVVQMLLDPVLGRRWINGVRPYLGYRNFETQDASRTHPLAC